MQAQAPKYAYHMLLAMHALSIPQTTPFASTIQAEANLADPAFPAAATHVSHWPLGASLLLCKTTRTEVPWTERVPTVKATSTHDVFATTSNGYRRPMPGTRRLELRPFLYQYDRSHLSVGLQTWLRRKACLLWTEIVRGLLWRCFSTRVRRSTSCCSIYRDRRTCSKI